MVRWIALLIPTVFLPFGVSCGLRYLSVPEWAATSFAFLGIAGAPFWAWWGDGLMKRLQHEHRVLCPRCGKALIGLTGELALTTGRCGGCGDLIVTDDAAEPSKLTAVPDDSPLWDNEFDRPAR